jgi:hypothetical protein
MCECDRFGIERLIRCVTLCMTTYVRGGATMSVALNALLVVTYALLSCMRTASLYVNYGAPLVVWEQLTRLASTTTTHVNVCVGQEWHRYPSSFFLPSEIVHLRFVDAVSGVGVDVVSVML